MRGYLISSLVTVLVTITIGICGVTFKQPFSTAQVWAQSAEEENAAQKIEQKRKKIELHPEDFSGGDVGNAIGTVTAVFPVGGNSVIAYAQEFEEDVIVYSDDFGAVFISKVIWNKWQSLVSQQTGDGSNLFNYIGVPTNDYISHGSYADGRFERGCILIEPGSAEHVIYGEIYGKYINVAEEVGLPVSEQQNAPGQGRYQKFANGAIYWKADLQGAFAVWGETFERYETINGANSALGYPVSDTSPIYNENGLLIGTTTRFKSGTIYSGDNGKREVTGDLLSGYEKEGGPAGWLGFPVSDQQTNSAGDVYQDFEHGVLANYDPGTTQSGVMPFGKLQFYLERIQGYGGDRWGLGGSTDIYAYLNIYTPDGHVLDKRFPNDGNYGSSKDLEWSYDLIDHAQSDFYADVSLEIWDSDWLNSADHLGTVQNVFSVDNLWGAVESSEYQSDDMAAWFTVKNFTPYDSSKFREFMWWPFHNFKTEELTYDQYAATFADVETNDKWYLNPFNAIYYKIYDGIASNGNCFGMSLESIYTQLGRSLYAEPISRFYDEISEVDDKPDPSDSRHQSLINEINVKHGYQLGANMILWSVGMWGAGLTHDPMANFTLAKTAHELNNYPLISIFDDYLFGSGHSIRPIRYEEGVDCVGDGFTGKCDRIYVADPNVQYVSIQDDEFIEIEQGSNCYQYHGYDTKTYYAGCTWTGGRMFMQPFFLFSGSQVTPFGAVFDMINDGFFFLVGSTGRVNQITDGQNRTFFEPNLPEPPIRWEQMRKPTDGMAIPDLAPVMAVSNSDTLLSFQMYAGYGFGATHSYELIPAANIPDGEKYEAVFESGKISSIIQSPGTNGKSDIITAHNIGDKDKAVSFGIPSDGVAKNITWTIAGPDKQVWAELSNMKIAPGQTIKFQVTNGGYDLVYENDGPGITADLSVHSGAGSDIVHVGQVEIDPGQSGTLQYLLPVTAMTVTGQNYGENNWLLDPVTITLLAQDFSSQGVEVIQYSKDNMATWEEGDKGENPFEFIYGDVYEDEGATTLYYRSRDYVGNEEEPKSENFKIDTRNPIVNIAGDQTVHTRVEPFLVDFSVNDPVLGSGIQTTAANLDGTSVADGETVDLFWFSLGTHVLTVMGKDYAGRSTTESIAFEVNATLESLAETIRELHRRKEIDSNGIMKSLLAKVKAALKSSTTGKKKRKKSAGNHLKALLNELGAQSGKHISDRGAEMLSGDVNYVINNLP